MKTSELGKKVKFVFTVEDEEGMVDCGTCSLDGADLLLIEAYISKVTICFTPINSL